MSVSRKVGRWAGLKVARRVGKAIPFLGTAVAVALLAESVRRKGLVGGVVNTGLDAVPFLGALKNGIELLTADWIPDRPRTTAPGPTPGTGGEKVPTSRRRS